MRSGKRESFSSCVFDSVWFTTDGPTVTHRQIHGAPVPIQTHNHIRTQENCRFLVQRLRALVICILPTDCW